MSFTYRETLGLIPARISQHLSAAFRDRVLYAPATSHGLLGDLAADEVYKEAQLVQLKQRQDAESTQGPSGAGVARKKATAGLGQGQAAGAKKPKASQQQQQQPKGQKAKNKAGKGKAKVKGKNKNLGQKDKTPFKKGPGGKNKTE